MNLFAKYNCMVWNRSKDARNPVPTYADTTVPVESESGSLLSMIVMFMMVTIQQNKDLHKKYVSNHDPLAHSICYLRTKVDTTWDAQLQTKILQRL